MGGGNGAKSAQARARNAAKADKAAGGKSQLKVNAAATNILGFFATTRQPALLEHAQNKHSKGMEDCFPDYTP